MDPPILAVEGLRKSFGGLHAVKDVSFEVRRGLAHAIIGPNGAGKTTLFNLITGVLAPDAGRILFNGEDVAGTAPWRLVNRGIGRSFQQASLFWSFTSLKNIVLAEAAVHGATKKMYGTMPAEIQQRAAGIIDRMGLRAHSDVTASELSYGDQRSLEIATAMAVESKLLLLDEPTAGLAPSETRRTVDRLREISHELGVTVLFIEHDMEVVFGGADWITVLHEGRVLAEGSPEEIQRNTDVRHAYLGGDST